MFYETKMGIINSDTDTEGWCKITINLHEIEAVRPFINDDNKYEHTYLYLKSGLELMIYDDYDKFKAILKCRK